MSETLNYGINAVGYKIKPIDVLEDEMKEILTQFFGTSVDLSQQSVLWKMVQVPTTEISQLWLNAEQNYYNCFIQTAEGASLDLLGEDIAIIRKVAISSGVDLTIYKSTSSEVVVPAYSMFQTAEGVIFSTDEALVIPIGDPLTTTGTVHSTAIVAGIDGNVASGLILTPTNAISGVASSNNVDASEGGENVETDEEYRKRLIDYVRAVWTREAIRSAALNVVGVSGVKIIESAYAYTCLIVPTVVYTQDLEDLVDEAIEKVTPITVEYTIIEAEIVMLDLVSDVVLTSLYDEISAESDAGLEISEYITSLDIDDDVIKAKIIQAIMEVDGILNAYNLVMLGRPYKEGHEYQTGTLTYDLNYTTGNAVVEVTGTVGGNPHTFVITTDYTFGTSPAQIIFTGTGDLPDNLTDFHTTYKYPANAIGDIEINQENVAKTGDIDFTVV